MFQPVSSPLQTSLRFLKLSFARISNNMPYGLSACFIAGGYSGLPRFALITPDAEHLAFLCLSVKNPCKDNLDPSYTSVEPHSRAVMLENCIYLLVQACQSVWLVTFTVLGDVCICWSCYPILALT